MIKKNNYPKVALKISRMAFFPHSVMLRVPISAEEAYNFGIPSLYSTNLFFSGTKYNHLFMFMSNTYTNFLWSIAI